MFLIKTENCRITIQRQSFRKIGLNLFCKGMSQPEYVSVDSVESAIDVVDKFIIDNQEQDIYSAFKKAGYTLTKI